jgi:hypothetical protein
MLYSTTNCGQQNTMDKSGVRKIQWGIGDAGKTLIPIPVHIRKWVTEYGTPAFPADCKAERDIFPAVHVTWAHPAHA